MTTTAAAPMSPVTASLLAAGWTRSDLPASRLAPCGARTEGKALCRRASRWERHGRALCAQHAAILEEENRRHHFVFSSTDPGLRDRSGQFVVILRRVDDPLDVVLYRVRFLSDWFEINVPGDSI